MNKDNFETMRTLFKIIRILFDVNIVARASSKRVDILSTKDFRNINVKTLFNAITTSIDIVTTFLRKVYILKDSRKINLLIAIIITKVVATSIITFQNYFY